MCRVEERVYIGADGRRRKFEDVTPCHHSRHGKLCSNVKRSIKEYPNALPIGASYDGTSSHSSYDPPTPSGGGSYYVERRAPGSGKRPDRGVKEIIIDFGKKNKKYPSSRSQKRTSLTNSIGSNDGAIESPGSEASYTIRTGFPEASIAPEDQLHQAQGFNTRTAAPRSHHRHTSSASASSVPSLCATSDPDSPTRRRPARYPPTIVHNPPPGGIQPSSPTMTRGPPTAPPSPYKVTIAVPGASSSRDNIGADGLFPVDYSEFESQAIPFNEYNVRSAAPEIFDRDADRARQRKLKADAERRRQEETDHMLAQQLAKEDAQGQAQARQVRFEDDFETKRAKAREEERAENRYAESEKRRAENREAERRRKQKEQKEQDERAARDTQKDRDRKERERINRHAQEAEAEAKARERRNSRPPPRDSSKRQSRRGSVLLSQEQQRALKETEAFMAMEREAADQRDREERAAALRQQQATQQYWDPRGDQRYPAAGDSPGMTRRNSVSRGRRGSVSSTTPAVGLGRSNSQRRVSIIQTNPPTLDTAFQQSPYSTRPPSSHQNPFSPSSQLPLSARQSNSSYENPFAQPGIPPTIPDPWDARVTPDAQPTVTVHQPHLRQPSTEYPLRHRGEEVINVNPGHRRQPSNEQYTLRRRGEEVIMGAPLRRDEQHSLRRWGDEAVADVEERAKHERVRIASQKMGKVVGDEAGLKGEKKEKEEGRGEKRGRKK
ncbi:hypothetical protein CC78DRAFT_170594 [Lojkania enalia]|uniref:Uncharacterized protein n=1 Tax=Lojkania enalia TaxID=147567 RepID=A0A9P4JXY2_9PLEO|nr:hypothetical protein CC78DRAFT_170594 [Didymosphaeria enalia]